ncbi:MAG TPA: DUF3604 domain-containing protein, partial [Candidatus Limnocylindria bacterium]|nr:DUF3604 domain-containing protein [Candidatus Limnocylindria bacterium]
MDARGASPGPWARTEEREPCADPAPLRRPYFGDLHVHTSLSADAYIYGTRTGPRDAYGFARGEEITLSDDNEEQTRTARIDRALDFMAVTDHAEFFGEVDLCATPGSLVYDEQLCQVLRQPEPDLSQRFLATAQWLFPLGFPEPVTEHAFCATAGVDCDAAAVSVWEDIQAAAEEAYDRTSACTFTSFIGYEYTASLSGRHLHRNVIFRNEKVPAIALSYLDTFEGGVGRGLWAKLEAQCLEAGTGCEAVVIPHNSNMSGGDQFFDPADADDAARRERLERLVEIHQVKGNSECRFDQLVGAGAGTTDELCTFEIEPRPHQLPGTPVPPIDQFPTRNLVRNVLKDGLAFEQMLGVNPFRMGFTGSTDTHNANAGDVAEEGWPGIQGNEDSSPQRMIRDNMRTNPGGLTAVWAEENSRDALFAALARRETYATTGTRPVVRFFAGALTGVRCGRDDFVAQAYATGTPMGGEIGPVRGNRSPRFAVWVQKDPGTTEQPGRDLERVQVVKGWLDADGVTHERVFEVADAASGADVDRRTCTPTGSGAAELCALWEDPDFDPRQRAFYYVRVLEAPTCRWSTFVCKAAGVDPFAANCAEQAAAADPAFADCCLGEANDPFMSPIVRERAWTSPIWYRPDGPARLSARLRFGKESDVGVLDVRLRLGSGP